MAPRTLPAPTQGAGARRGVWSGRARAHVLARICADRIASTALYCACGVPDEWPVRRHRMHCDYRYGQEVD